MKERRGKNPPRNWISTWKGIDNALKIMFVQISGIVWPMRWLWHLGYFSLRCLLFRLRLGPFLWAQLCLTAIMVVSREKNMFSSSNRIKFLKMIDFHDLCPSQFIWLNSGSYFYSLQSSYFLWIVYYVLDIILTKSTHNILPKALIFFKILMCTCCFGGFLEK